MRLSKRVRPEDCFTGWWWGTAYIDLRTREIVLCIIPLNWVVCYARAAVRFLRLPKPNSVRHLALDVEVEKVTNPNPVIYRVSVLPQEDRWYVVLRSLPDAKHTDPSKAKGVMIGVPMDTERDASAAFKAIDFILSEARMELYKK